MNAALAAATARSTSAAPPKLMVPDTSFRRGIDDFVAARRDRSDPLSIDVELQGMLLRLAGRGALVSGVGRGIHTNLLEMHAESDAIHAWIAAGALNRHRRFGDESVVIFVGAILAKELHIEMIRCRRFSRSSRHPTSRTRAQDTVRTDPS